jgi:hypothetical protein
MPDSDARDRKTARITGIALVVILLLALAGVVLLVPAAGAFVAASLTPGLDLRGAALWSFGVTVVLFMLFAIVAGDGLLGELQFMLAGFLSFFLIFTLLIAWIF